MNTNNAAVEDPTKINRSYYRSMKISDSSNLMGNAVKVIKLKLKLLV